MIDLIQNALNQGSWFHIILVLLLVYVGGLITSFTPCIFPMIPITFSIVGKCSDKDLKKSHIIKRVVSYGLGVSSAFVFLGIISVLTQSIFGSVTQHILFKIIMANLFILIGLNTLGAISMPQFILPNRDSSSYIGLYFMGIAAGATLSPCTIPILAIVLTFAAQTNLYLGSLMMFMYSWGFMTLILLLTVFGNSTFNRFLKNRNHLHLMDKLLALLCFIVAEWILINIG